MHLSARSLAVTILGAVFLIAAIGLGVHLATDSQGSSPPRTAAVVVNGNPIPRSLVLKGVRIRLSTSASGPAQPGSPAYRQVQDQIVRQLVQDVTVVAEARRLGLVEFTGPVANHVATHAAQTQALWAKLYNYAARNVPDPDDATIVQAQSHDQDALSDLLNERQLRIYNAWQTRRDQVAGAWFQTLFRRYGARTAYAPGFRPTPI